MRARERIPPGTPVSRVLYGNLGDDAICRHHLQEVEPLYDRGCLGGPTAGVRCGAFSGQAIGLAGDAAEAGLAGDDVVVVELAQGVGRVPPRRGKSGGCLDRYYRMYRSVEKSAKRTRGGVEVEALLNAEWSRTRWHNVPRGIGVELRGPLQNKVVPIDFLSGGGLVAIQISTHDDGVIAFGRGDSRYQD